MLPSRGAGDGGSGFSQMIGCEGGFQLLAVGIRLWFIPRQIVCKCLLETRRRHQQRTSAESESSRLPHRELTGLLRPSSEGKQSNPSVSSSRILRLLRGAKGGPLVPQTC